MEHRDINVVDLVEARSKEIQLIEESIKATNKKTMLFQRLPFYKRRRNRNYDQRKSKKFSYRKKDRHFLRTHTYYSKRFFMLNLGKVSIPVARRVKSSKYIYKSQERGFVFDESFRGGAVYDKDYVLGLDDSGDDHSDSTCILESHPLGVNHISVRDLLSQVDLLRHNEVQSINNEYEAIITESSIVVVGKVLRAGGRPLECVFSVLRHSGVGQVLSLKSTYKNNSGGLESYKILCRRSEAMEIYQKLVSNNIIPICLSEIHRLSLENDVLSVYDNVSSGLYRSIEAGVNAEIVSKYERTPKSKKQSYDLSRLYLSEETPAVYFIFKVAKGSVSSCAEIFDDDECIGRVVRSAYKFGEGRCFGLGFLRKSFASKIEYLFSPGRVFFCKNLTQSNYYEISITKIIECS